MRARLGPMDAAVANRIPMGGDDMDAPETSDGRREQAPVEVVVESDSPKDLRKEHQTEGRNNK